ncbi:gliding motility-associated C-terminal domain-containing protein [Paraflavitalea speifideaquila]|uniref:T9SS type B sorting domain-containing protein n=1 Tax=Paraflavitalea speifideaquila TaxID=3076558 RepID=UPI0028F08EF2|nr:gliding motility-associated C-terminal domain-containing protein [Paraflavitalea speifideiaquila]
MSKFSTICNDQRVSQVNTTMYRSVVVLLLILLLSNYLTAQTCTTLGQNPSTAFPVCGSTTFSQTTVPICGNRNVNVPGCGTSGYSDKNPFWYRFTCFTAGTLGFLITPNDLGDDYDWMLYDITGVNPDDVFTNPNLVVTGNWAGTYGLTGASATGVTNIECGSNPSDGKPTFAKMPTLLLGHTYLLLISHFTDSQSGYKLSFGGGTAVITDPKLPALQSASAACGGTVLRVKLNKKMKCNSLAADGSDFLLAPAAGNIVAAVGIGCSSSFDMDSVVLTVNHIIAPGTYDIIIRKGADGNTLKDNCDREITDGERLAVVVYPIVPTPMDSITAITSCKPDELRLVFKNGMRCSSIAADGSDFMIPGLPVGIKGASGSCVNGLTTLIKVQLTAPIQVGGTWNIQLRRGSDGNTIIDECGMETPAGATLNFTTYDTVNADFTYNILWGCKKDTVEFFHPGANQVTQWYWTFEGAGSSPLQNPVIVFPTFGSKKVNLIVNNGVCSDSTETVVLLDNAMDARFGYPEFLCPEDQAVFTDSSLGKIINWDWTFGNGNSSLLQKPDPQKYQRPLARTKLYTVRLIIENDKHCFDTAFHQVEVVTTCYITVPNAFSPNGDGNNDLLYPLNAFKATELEFKVYNRYGQIVFETTDWKKRWDGTLNGQKQPSGTYVWVLSFVHRETKEKIFQKGTTALIR